MDKTMISQEPQRKQQTNFELFAATEGVLIVKGMDLRGRSQYRSARFLRTGLTSINVKQTFETSPFLHQKTATSKIVPNGIGT